jgi:hypothetical protein
MTLSLTKSLLKRQLQRCVPEAACQDEMAACQMTTVDGQSLSKNLAAYVNCRQFAAHEAAFAEQVKCLQRWQTQRVRATHYDCLHHPDQRQAAEFLLIDAYEQLDIVSLAPQLSRIVVYAERIYPQPLLRIAELALAVNALTAQLDQAIAEVLFEQMQVQQITEADYCRAFLSVNGVAQRQLQLQLILELMQSLERQAHNKMVLMAFKLAKAPAYASGFRNLYSFMATGLAALRSLPDAYVLLEQIVSVELALNNAIAAGDSYSLALEAQAS